MHIVRLLFEESEFVFNHMLFKASQSQKTVYLLNEDENLLLLKVKKYLANASAQTPKNIHINDKAYFEMKDQEVLSQRSNQFI